MHCIRRSFRWDCGVQSSPPRHRPPSCVWGAKLGIAERERRRTEETIVSFPFPRVMDGQFPPAAAASQPKTEPNRIACSRSVHGNWIIVFQRLPPPTWIDGLTSRILPNPTRRIMKRASERPSEDLCPSVRRVRRSEAKNSLWDHRAARATGRARASTLPRRRALEASRIPLESALSFNLFAQSFSGAVVLFLPI